MALYIHSSQDCLNIMSGPSASLTGTQINAMANTTGLPQHNGNNVSLCKGAFLSAAGTTGYLAVHLIDDPVGTWYLVYLVAGATPWVGLFDSVSKTGTNGTTVTCNGNLTIFPYLYS